MTNDDTGGMGGAGAGGGGALAAVPRPEQLMALGALLILVVADLIGDIFVDEYSVTDVSWLLAIGLFVTIWMVRMSGKSTPLPYQTTLVILGYGLFIMTVRDFIADLDASWLGGSNIIYALAYYIGAVLVAFGAYQVSRS